MLTLSRPARLSSQGPFPRSPDWLTLLCKFLLVCFFHLQALVYKQYVSSRTPTLLFLSNISGAFQKKPFSQRYTEKEYNCFAGNRVGELGGNTSLWPCIPVRL